MMSDDIPELPDFLDRKKNGIEPELRRTSGRRRQPADAIVWPSKAIARALREKRKAAKRKAKEAAAKRRRLGL